MCLNLKTNRYDRRSNWVKIVTVQEEDGENAGAAIIADDTVRDSAEDKEQDTTHVSPATHHVEDDTDLPMTATEQEAVENESARKHCTK